MCVHHCYSFRMQKLILYTDGGARGNPGSAGVGIVIADESGKVLKEDYQAIGTATNNEAEYRAVILGLETLKKKFGKEKLTSAEIEVRLDSELVTEQLSGHYQINEKTLQLLFMTIWNLRVTIFHKIRFTHIPRAQNAHADRLANKAMDEVSTPPTKPLF